MGVPHSTGSQRGGLLHWSRPLQTVHLQGSQLFFLLRGQGELIPNPTYGACTISWDALHPRLKRTIDCPSSVIGPDQVIPVSLRVIEPTVDPLSESLQRHPRGNQRDLLNVHPEPGDPWLLIGRDAHVNAVEARKSTGLRVLSA